MSDPVCPNGPASTTRALFSLFFGLMFLVCPCATSVSAESKPFVISAIVNEQTHAIAKYVLTEAYARIGLKIRFDDLPGLRALEWADKGITDGDVARIMGTEKKYPRLIRVKVPVIHFKGVAFTKSVNAAIGRWQDLAPYRIGVIRGIRYSTMGTQGMDPFFANDMTHLFSILDKGRIEIAVAVLDAGMIEIHRNFRNSGIRVVGSPLFSAPLYHFLHRRNEPILAELEAALEEMTGSGDMARLRQQALTDLMNR